jgi:hypothetical protein
MQLSLPIQRQVYLNPFQISHRVIAHPIGRNTPSDVCMVVDPCSQNPIFKRLIAMKVL